MDRYERAIAVRRTLGEKRERLADVGVGPACRGCRYGYGVEDGICEHLIHSEGSPSPVDGQPLIRSKVSVTEARSIDGLCGPEALLFEPASPLTKLSGWGKETAREMLPPLVTMLAIGAGIGAIDLLL